MNYLYAIGFLIVGIYLIMDTIKNPASKTDSNALNYRGILFGIVSCLAGIYIVVKELLK